MTALARAFLGGALGAVLTLCVHPSSRAYVLSEFRRIPASAIVKAVSLEHSALPTPTNRVAVGVWVLLAAEKLNSGAKLTRAELKSLIDLTVATEKIDPENAYWPQMDAVFNAHAGNLTVARAQWQRASHCKSWNDQQTKRLLTDHQVLSALTNSDQGWLYGYTYFERSDAAALQIQNYAKSLIKDTTVSSDTGLLIRYMTIRNGSLLRDGSRWIRVGERGVDMVELATYPPLLLVAKNTKQQNIAKRIWIAQTRLTSRLREVGLSEQSDQAESDFQRNDSWKPLIERTNPESNVTDLCLATIALATLPGCLVLTSMVGAAIYLAGKVSQERLAKMRLFPTYGVAACSGLVAAFVDYVSHSWIAAVAAALCIVFLAMGPFVPRKRRLEDLGPLFTFTLLAFWFMTLAAFAFYSSSISTAAQSLLPKLSWGEYLSDAPMFAAVGCISFAVMCMSAPAWAVVHRYGTPDLFGVLMRRFGKIAMVGGLILCVISGPLSVYADFRCRGQLAQIVENEPNYYLYQ